MRDARTAIVNYAKMCGFSQQETHEIALAAGEALANAVEHGNKDLGYVSVACRFADGELRIEVSDDGPGFDFATVATRGRDPEALRGFGISIMHALMDGVHYEGHGSRVSLRKRLRGDTTEQTKEA